MTQQSSKIDFAAVDSLRRHMLLTISDIAVVFNVSRETYYTWLKGGYPRPKRENFVRGRVRQLIHMMREQGWPQPEVIAAVQKDRLKILLDAIGPTV